MWLSLEKKRYLTTFSLWALVLFCPYALPAAWYTNFSTSTTPALLTNPVENQQWFIVFGAVMLLFAAGLGLQSTTKPIRNPVAVLITISWNLYTLIRAAALPTSEFPQQEILLQTAVGSIFIVTALGHLTTFNIIRFQLLAALAVIPLAILAICQKLGVDPVNYSQIIPGTKEAAEGKLLVASTFGHPNYMGSYLAPVFVLTLGLLCRQHNKPIRIIGFLSLVATLSALTVGGTRGPLFGLLAGTIAYVLITWKSNPQKCFGYKPLIVLCVIGVISSAVMLCLGDRFSATKEIASRLYYWTTALQMVPQNPIFGIGPGQFNNLFWNQIAQQPSAFSGGSWHFILNTVVRGVQPGQLHNDHLQVLVENGIVGAALWTILWASVFFTVRTKPIIHFHELQIKAALTGSLIAILVDATFGFPFHLPCSGIFAWYLIGIVCSWNPLHDRPEPNKITQSFVKV